MRSVPGKVVSDSADPRPRELYAFIPRAFAVIAAVNAFSLISLCEACQSAAFSSFGKFAELLFERGDTTAHVQVFGLELVERGKFLYRRRSPRASALRRGARLAIVVRVRSHWKPVGLGIVGGFRKPALGIPRFDHSHGNVLC